MKILLIGKNGQVGWQLQRTLAPLGELTSTRREDLDITNLNALHDYINNYQPNMIVNAAAYTAVDKAESEQDLAYQINSNALAVLAEEANKLDAWLIHYSTDYVFDGKKPSPYNEDDITCPTSVYGKSKLEGELQIQKKHSKYLIFRTSWVFGNHGYNFAKTILRLAQKNQELKVVNDQYGAPTSAELIADITALAISQLKQNNNETSFSGIYHLTPNGETSWHGFAQSIIERAHQYKSISLKTLPESVHPVTTDEYPTTAKRPKNSRLNTSKLCEKFNVYLPDWHYHVHRFVDELACEEKL